MSAAPFHDWVVRPALMAQVGPFLEVGCIAHGFAYRAGKGAHRAIEDDERCRDLLAFVLRCDVFGGDVFGFFPAIDHAILNADVRGRIACTRVLVLMDKIVDGSNRKEP